MKFIFPIAAVFLMTVLYWPAKTKLCSKPGPPQSPAIAEAPSDESQYREFEKQYLKQLRKNPLAENKFAAP